MKTIIIIALSALMAVAEPLSFAWDANPPEQTVEGYKFYKLDVNDQWVLVTSTSATSITVDAERGGTVGLTAYRGSIESEKTSLVIPTESLPNPTTPQGFRLVDSSTSLIELTNKEVWVATLLPREDTGNPDPFADNKGPEKLIDNRIDADWNAHASFSTEFNAAISRLGHPHNLQINLGAVYTLGALTIQNRQDTGTAGSLVKYEIFLSGDGSNWGTAVTSGVLDPNTKDPQTISFTATEAQYIRIRSLETSPDPTEPQLMIAEVSVSHWASE